jgi:hypothetical protein
MTNVLGPVTAAVTDLGSSMLLLAGVIDPSLAHFGMFGGMDGEGCRWHMACRLHIRLSAASRLSVLDLSKSAFSAYRRVGLSLAMSAEIVVQLRCGMLGLVSRALFRSWARRYIWLDERDQVLMSLSRRTPATRSARRAAPLFAAIRVLPVELNTWDSDTFPARIWL